MPKGFPSVLTECMNGGSVQHSCATVAFGNCLLLNAALCLGAELTRSLGKQVSSTGAKSSTRSAAAAQEAGASMPWAQDGLISEFVTDTQTKVASVV